MPVSGYCLMIPGQEWIITNRNGSYASSTRSLANTRSYHGLLVRNVNEQFLRMVLVNKIFEVVATDSGEVSLDANYYGDVVYPDGYRFLRKFSDFPVPAFRYSVNGVDVWKEIAIHPLWLFPRLCWRVRRGGFSKTGRYRFLSTGAPQRSHNP